MALRGDLASVDLAQVFQMLALNQKVGLLSIQSKQLWKVLHFDHRGVTVHHNVHAVLDRVVASFVRAGRLAEDALEEVRDHAARMGQPLTDSLLAGGFLEAEELDDQYRMELEEEMYDLFFCREARFEFFEGATEIEGYDGQTDEHYFFNCDSVVMEAARRIDEWAYIVERIPSNSEFYVPEVEAISADDYGAEGAALFELLDGRRSVGRLIEMTGLPNFQACKVLSIMLDACVIAPIDDAELARLGSECMDADRLSDAIDLFERAAAIGQGLPEIHGLAAEAYQAADRYEDAARHFEAQAQCLVDMGDAPGAAQRLLELRAMMPTALGARERLVDLVVDNDISLAGFDAMAEGKELVDLLIEFGDIERVRGLLERLLLVAPEDPDLKKALISVHVKAGDQQRVAELYESIADDLVVQGNPLEAVGYLQKILLMDRSRSDISERVRELYESDERNRRRSRSLGVLAFLFCALVVLGAFYWFYNERAEKEFAAIDVGELLAHEDFAGAAIAHEEFIRKFPLTTAVSRAETELQQIEAARQRFEARRATVRAARDRELQRIRTEYQAAWDAHREQFLGGKPEDAIASVERVRELLDKAGTAEDVAWALEHQVERNWQRLQDYVSASEKLAADYAKAAAAEDWLKARDLALRLKSEYDNTTAAAGVHVPVMINTRPAGARLLQRGKPLVQTVDGRTTPLLTPALVFCSDAKSDVEVVTDLEGFEPRTITISPADNEFIDVVLAVVPEHRVKFPAPLQTGIATGEGWIAVGLRGGKLGISRADGSRLRTAELSGLKAVDSTPRVQGGRAFFVSNEDTIECISLDTAQSARGWPVALKNGAATELMVGDGRVAVVDTANVLHCWEQASGAHVWALSLDSAPSGPPTIDKRRIFVATNDGRVFIIDASNGKTSGVLRSKDSITTRVLSDDGTIAFGCSSGIVRAVSLEDGRVLWDAPTGQPVIDGMIAMGSGVVCGVREGVLVTWDQQTGKELGKMELKGTLQPGLAMQGPRLLLRLQRGQVRNLPARDVLQAVDLTDSSVLWEFESTVVGAGSFGVDNLTVAFPGAADEVVTFR